METQQKASILQKIEIADIKDNLVLMKDESVLGVMMVNSVNFALKSTQEQDAIIYNYQQFLNSLDFPLQIMVAIRKFDISDYVEMLSQKRNEQENELIRIQTSEYMDFVKELTQVVNIMSNFFYVIVPFAQTEEQKVMSMTEKLGKFFKKTDKQIEAQTYEQMKTGLWQRLGYINSGLTACGLKTATLNNEELLELFYRMYNPDTKEKPKLDSSSLI